MDTGSGLSRCRGNQEPAVTFLLLIFSMLRLAKLFRVSEDFWMNFDCAGIYTERRLPNIRSQVKLDR